ncbi:MAG: hypothetical protein RI965_2032, partial [Bacteroidota bacterium]
MFDSKNYSPTGIALFIAITAGIISMLLVFISSGSLAHTIVTFIFLFITCFLLTRFLIEAFINKKIKLIYKFIHQTKASKREEFFQKNVLPQQSLEEVGEEVLKW